MKFAKQPTSRQLRDVERLMGRRGDTEQRAILWSEIENLTSELGRYIASPEFSTRFVAQIPESSLSIHPAIRAVNQLVDANTTFINNEVADVRAEFEAVDTVIVTALESLIDDANAAITTEQLARANADSALAGQIGTVETRLDDAETAITNEQLARSNADSALASDISTVSANLASANAAVSQNASAIATIENYQAATLVFRVEAGGGSAGLELVAADDPVNGPASAFRVSAQNILLDGTVLAQHIAAGEITSDKLAVGFGANQLENSDFLEGLGALWLQGQGDIGSEPTLSIRDAGSNWAGVNYPTLRFGSNFAGASTDGYARMIFRPSNLDGSPGIGYLVENNGVYEWSARLSLHRCNVRMRMRYLNAAGGYYGYSSEMYVLNNNNSPGKNDPEEFELFGGLFEVPPGARYCTPVVELFEKTSSSSGLVFVNKPFLSQSRPGASLTPYSGNGQTVVDGGRMRTGTLKADAVDTDDFNASGLAIFGRGLMSANFNGWINSSGEITNNGTQGFALTAAGEMVLNNLVARDWIQLGAVDTDRLSVSAVTDILTATGAPVTFMAEAGQGALVLVSVSSFQGAAGTIDMYLNFFAYNRTYTVAAGTSTTFVYTAPVIDGVNTLALTAGAGSPTIDEINIFVFKR